MRSNLPVIAQEYDYPSNEMLVSTTDTRGHITHCNSAFVQVSGFSYDELVGQPHNMIRHPDMPAEAFKDMWSTVGRGRPWTGMVKNRRKDGSFYWVEANVTPIMEGGKPRGYMSVRTKPTRQQVQDAEALYARMRSERAANRPTFTLSGGTVRPLGWRGALASLARVGMTQRYMLVLAVMVGVGVLPLLLGVTGLMGLLLQVGLQTACAVVMVLWFKSHVTDVVLEAERFASDLSGCNLNTAIALDYPAPLGSLVRCLWQIQINMRAVIGDVHTEIHGFTQVAAEIASGSMDLSERTESQASSLQQTAASMEQLSGTVQQTAETALQVAQQSDKSTHVATRGGEAVHQVGVAMQNIDKSIYEAARIDGISATRRFLSITVPMLKPVILFTTVTSTIGTLQLFDEPMNITNGLISDVTLTLSLYIYKLSFRYVPNFGYAATVSYVIVVLVAILAFVQFYAARERD